MTAAGPLWIRSLPLFLAFLYRTQHRAAAATVAGSPIAAYEVQQHLSAGSLVPDLHAPVLVREDDRHTHESQLIEFDAPDAGKVSSSACSPFCGTFALANNAWGDANVVPHGFLRTRDGHFVSFDATGAGLGAGLNQGTAAYSINDRGEIARQLESSSSVFHGFVRSRGGEIESFDPPNSVTTMVCAETCLNSEGAIAGFFLDLNNTLHGFVRKPDGNITVFDVPEAGADANQGTVAASINTQNVVAGYFIDSNNVSHGFLRSPEGKFTTFDAPLGATGPGQGTLGFSVNLAGAVAAEFVDSNNATHRFSRGPNGTFATFDAPDAGVGPNQGTRPSTNSLTGAVVGWYVDAGNLNHGFLWQPWSRINLLYERRSDQ